MFAVCMYLSNPLPHAVIVEAESAVFNLEWSTNENCLLLSWTETGGFPRNSIEVKELKCRDQYKLYLTTSYQPASGKCIDMNVPSHKNKQEHIFLSYISVLYCPIFLRLWTYIVRYIWAWGCMTNCKSFNSETGFDHCKSKLLYSEAYWLVDYHQVMMRKE